MDASVRVLWVDVHSDVPRNLRKDEDTTVDTVTSVSEALARIEEDLFDCIVSEQKLQQQSGIEFLETVREIYATLPFVLYTAHGSEQVASRAIAAGVTEYLQKSRRTEQDARLLDRIKTAVEKHQEPETPRQPDVYEQVSAGFFRVGPDWRYTYVNERATQLVGRSADELLGECVWDAFPELEGTAFEEALRTAMNAQETASVTEYFPTHESWYDVTVHPAERGLSINFHDVTAHKERERQFEAIFNNTYTFVGLLKPDGTLVEANDTALAFGGIERRDVVGKPIWEAHWFQASEETRATAREAVEQARNGTLFRDEIWVQGADREAIIDFTVRPITNEQGTVTYLVPEGRDITEQKQHVRKLETLIDNVPGIVYQCRNESGWPMESIRGEVEELTDFPATTLRTDEKRYGTDVIHPDDREHVWESTQRQLESRDSFEVTYRIVTGDGCLKWVWERGQRVYSTEKGVEVLEGFITEITELKQTAQELREERDFTTKALDSLDDLFYVVGTDGEMKRWNSRLSEITGYSDEEIATMKATEFFPPDEQGQITEAIEETLTTGAAIVESDLLTAEGERIPYEFTGDRLTDVEGELTGLVGIGRDITDQRERERELERQREHLAALNSFNDVAREITDAVIEQSTPEDIERITCEKLAASDAYTFAWFIQDESEDSGWCEQQLSAKVLQTGDVVVGENVCERLDSAQQQAEDAEFGSLAGVPVVHDGKHYRVLGVYTSRSDAFGEDEREVLGQLGEVIGYVLYALERKDVLATALELRFRSDQLAAPFLAHTDEDSNLVLDAAVSLNSEERIEYWMVSGMETKAFQKAVEALPAVSDARLLSTVEGTARFEVSAEEDSLTGLCAESEGVLKSATLVNETFEFTTEFPETVDTETVTETFRRRHPDIELVSQERILTPSYLRQMVDESLTEQQKVVLQTAYFGGYFNKPRHRTGVELAERLGITKQTFHHHLRHAEATVLEHLFEDPTDPLI